MSPEELFKIEDTEIPESKEENTTSSEEKSVENPKIDIFSKDLTVEDLMTFLKQNNVPNNQKIVEKYYEEIVTNNKEKESIVEVIKELDSQKETLLEQLQSEPDNKIVLKKINDLEEKISDLNTTERTREDNTKIIVKEIFNTINEKIENTEISETISENAQNPEVSRIELENAQNPEVSRIELENAQNPEVSRIELENTKTQDNPQIIPEKINETAQIKSEDATKLNPLEKINVVTSNENKEVLNSMEKNEALEEIKKNNKMLDEMSKNIDSGFEMVLKSLSENIKDTNSNKNQEVRDVEPTHVENPQISQPAYIAEYRKSLRKYGGIEPFVGYETQLKADNLGSYI
jgi:hypothetical protein